MGTTLTGTTPQDTYDALIKVGDNGIITGSLKTLSDGEGHDTALALSTGAASVTGTLAVSGNATFDTSTLFVDAANNRVGVGTITPADPLTIFATTQPILSLRDNGIDATYGGYIKGFGAAGGGGQMHIGVIDSNTFRSGIEMTEQLGSISFRTSASQTERMRINSTGNVGIGTSAPLVKVDVRTTSTTNAVIGAFINPSSANNTTKGASISLALADTAGDIKDTAFLRGFAGNANVTTGGLAIDVRQTDGVPTEIARFTPAGLTFNGDTAAANALDDYEEGTWTPNFTLLSGSVASFTSSGSYTKIGRQVSLTLALEFISTTAAVIDLITGMPFASQNTNQVAIGSVREKMMTGNMYQWEISANATTGGLRRYDNNNAILNGFSFIGTLTYFV